MDKNMIINEIVEDFSNRYFIRIDADSNIIHGFSDAFEQPQDSDILINAQGGYQFRLYPGGEENPPLRDEYGVLLYYWDGEVKNVVTEVI